MRKKVGDSFIGVLAGKPSAIAHRLHNKRQPAQEVQALILQGFVFVRLCVFSCDKEKECPNI